MSTTDVIVAAVEGMCSQEKGAYRVNDYLNCEQVRSTVEKQTLKIHPSHFAVDASSRTAMVKWCYRVVDFCHFKRETVAIASSYLDRFLGTETGRDALLDRRLFQLAVVTSLYTAVKIHEPQTMDPSLIASLSNGSFDLIQVECMEMAILMAINWRMNPPTTLALVRHYLALIPDFFLSDPDKTKILSLAKYHTELLVCEYRFALFKPSIQAAAILLETIETTLDACQPALASLRQIVRKHARIDIYSRHFTAFQSALAQFLSDQNAGAAEYSNSQANSNIEFGNVATHKVADKSPRSVFVGRIRFHGGGRTPHNGW